MATNVLRFNITLDLNAAIAAGLADLDFSGVGPDGDTEFDVEDISFDVEDVLVPVVISLTRTGGKFVSNDDLVGVVADNLGEFDGVAASL